MFALIKREIEDNIAFFLAAVLFSAIIIAVAFSLAYSTEKMQVAALSALIPTIVVAIFGFAAMGASQMGTDRSRKVSTFLSALTVTRSQILIARIITGTFAILVFLVPLAITAKILLRLFAPPYPVYDNFVTEIFTTTLLMAFACYCLGLQIGWGANKAITILGVFIFTIILATLITVKGFGFHIVAILLIFIIMSLMCIWQKFVSVSL